MTSGSPHGFPPPDPASPDTVDLAAIAASDAWLTAVSHHLTPATDTLAEALHTWLAHLDPVHPHLPPHQAQPRTTRRLRRRRGAIAAAAALTLLAGAGTAAASPGNPIHRIVFRAPAAAAHDQVDHAQSATELLDEAAALIARGAGHLDSAVHTAAAHLLNDARTHIDQLPPTPVKTRLTTRHAHLEAQLDQLPHQEDPQPPPDAPTSTKHTTIPTTARHTTAGPSRTAEHPHTAGPGTGPPTGGSDPAGTQQPPPASTERGPSHDRNQGTGSPSRPNPSTGDSPTTETSPTKNTHPPTKPPQPRKIHKTPGHRSGLSPR